MCTKALCSYVEYDGIFQSDRAVPRDRDRDRDPPCLLYENSSSSVCIFGVWGRILLQRSSLVVFMHKLRLWAFRGDVIEICYIAKR